MMGLEWVIPKGKFKSKKKYLRACRKIKGICHILTWEQYKLIILK
jgi:hypothetical protein